MRYPFKGHQNTFWGGLLIVVVGPLLPRLLLLVTPPIS